MTRGIIGAASQGNNIGNNDHFYHRSYFVFGSKDLYFVILHVSVLKNTYTLEQNQSRV